MLKIIIWQQLMSIFTIGINHKTASITLREQIYFAFDKLSLYLQDLLNRELASEAVLLSTCNRSELYCETENILNVIEWFHAQTPLSHEELTNISYVYSNEEAIAHIMQVACGLDSMILGEPQILGQMKDAFSESLTAGGVNSSFHHLFQQVFSVAKEIRSTTAIGACPVSVASAAVHFAKQHSLTFNSANMLLIGAGDLAQLLFRYLAGYTDKQIAIVNRNIEKAAMWASQCNAQLNDFNQLITALVKADIVFSATGSATPIINNTIMCETMRLRNYRPIMLIDVAVPRDIEPTVKQFPNVQLFCIDDLKSTIEQNRQDREHAALKAREMIDQKSRKVFVELNSLDKVSHTIRAYRGQIEDICRDELAKAKQLLIQGNDPLQVLDMFAYTYTQKLLHTPSVQLRQAGVQGRFELLSFAKQLFAIPDPEVEPL